jgi:hypothetical protein
VFAIVDSVHHLPIDYKNKLVLEYVWFGRVHEQGYCKLEITLDNENFLICKENRCDTLTVSPPLYGTKKAKHKWLYKRTKLSWDEGNDKLRVE